MCVDPAAPKYRKPDWFEMRLGAFGNGLFVQLMVWYKRARVWDIWGSGGPLKLKFSCEGLCCCNCNLRNFTNLFS